MSEKQPKPKPAFSGWIKEQWEDYRHNAVRQGAHEQEIDAARTIFYAGVLTATRQYVTLYNQAPAKVLPHFLQDLSNELAAFQHALAEGEDPDTGPPIRIILPGDPDHPGVGPLTRPR